MASVSEMIGTPRFEFGMSVIVDNLIYLLWLPLLLASHSFAYWFARLTSADPEQSRLLRERAETLDDSESAPTTLEYHYLLAVAAGVTWLSGTLGARLPSSALVGYAVGTQAAWLTALACRVLA